MDNSKEAIAARLSEWSQRIKEREESGMSISDFCEVYDIPVSKYNYWARRVKQAAGDDAPREIVDVTQIVNGEAFPVKTVALERIKRRDNNCINVLLLQISEDTPIELISRIIKAASHV